LGKAREEKYRPWQGTNKLKQQENDQRHRQEIEDATNGEAYMKDKRKGKRKDKIKDKIKDNMKDNHER
jgi:hypothetical protein